MFCVKMHLMEKLAAFIKYVPWLYFDAFIALMQYWKQNIASGLW